MFTLQQFLCFDLKTGIMAVGALNAIYSGFAAFFHLLLSVDSDDATTGTSSTASLAGSVINISLMLGIFYGAKNERRMLFLPFLIVGGIIFGIISCIIVIYVFIYPFIIILFLPIAFVWYIWLAVFSLYRLMDPANPGYVPSQIPETAVYLEKQPPQVYYENKMADAV